MSDNPFSPDYATARQRLLAAAAGADWSHRAIMHPEYGPSGEPLALDVLRRGPADANRVLVINSATHGAEGFSGSAIQLALIQAAPVLPDGVALLLIHGVNPHGFAYLRRVTEDNVDLNRNFIDFTAPLPTNSMYRNLSPTVNPIVLDDSDALIDRLESLRIDMGDLPFMKALSGGQYDDPAGIQFGGAGSTWSRRTIERIWREELGAAAVVVQLDVHTGLGPRGLGMLMMAANPDEPHRTLTADWFGPMMVSARPASAEQTVLGGYLNAGLERAVAAWVIPMTLEFGTEPLAPVIAAVIADNWLHRQVDPAPDVARSIKGCIRAVFDPQDDEWRAAVLARGAQVLGQALAGLGTLDIEKDLP
ncbi:hypothetical protein ASE75_02905 [Sphingomonas sp. Leaf17]|uniref:DUF2817 domain-containing protein n=1 Tax=Sphingomonas sp. Leaf17 TaxID=1735683 RepID=UPI0006F86830|nr:DUF2817 domain-containing protein [Sphingomonas sp. Leaf17]KQM67851.1 hypothetical protein ASE75_02905 [Sphingomonas sp. Leaf17]